MDQDTKNKILKYPTFSHLFMAFQRGEIAVKNDKGEIGLYGNCPDWKYWEQRIGYLWNEAHAMKLIHTGQYVEIWENSGGNYELVALPALYDEYEEKFNSEPWNVLLSDITEDIFCNSELEWIDPAQIGAMTEADMFGITEQDEYGTIEKVISLWLFPDYMIINPLEELFENGRVIFKKGLES